MVSAEDFDPRILSELARYTRQPSTHDMKMKSSFGMPEDYDTIGFRKTDQPNSRFQTDVPPDLTPPRGKVAWTGDAYLREIDLTALRRRIQRYRRISPTLVDRPSIRRELYKTLKAPGFASVVLPFRDVSVPRGTYLWRARKIDSPTDIQMWSDVWTAPPHFIGAGRLNDVGEPLLYTAWSPLTALLEINAKPGDLIALSLFHSSHRIWAVDMSSHATIKDLQKGNRRKLDIIMKFLVGAFSQKVPTGDQSRYITPDLIAKEIFNPYPEIYSGWYYKSVADSRTGTDAYNLALRGSTAKNLVDYKFTQIVRLQELTEFGEGNVVVAVLRRGSESDSLEPAPGSAD